MDIFFSTNFIEGGRDINLFISVDFLCWIKDGQSLGKDPPTVHLQGPAVWNVYLQGVIW
jgi:hypothetical protein